MNVISALECIEVVHTGTVNLAMGTALMLFEPLLKTISPDRDRIIYLIYFLLQPVR